MCGTIPYRGVTGTKMSDEHNGGEIEASLSNNGGQNIHPAFVCMAKKVTKILLQNNFNRKGDSDVTHECFNKFMKIVATYMCYMRTLRHSYISKWHCCICGTFPALWHWDEWVYILGNWFTGLHLFGQKALILLQKRTAKNIKSKNIVKIVLAIFSLYPYCKICRSQYFYHQFM